MSGIGVSAANYVPRATVRPAGFFGIPQVDSPAWTGSGGGGMSQFTLSGSKDAGSGAWKLLLGRPFSQSIQVGGSTNLGGGTNFTAMNRMDGSVATLTGGGDGAGGFFGVMNGSQHVGDNDSAVKNFSANIDVQGTGPNTWSGKIDIPGTFDPQISGSTDPNGWSVSIFRPGGLPRSFSGTGPISLNQEMAIVAASELDVKDLVGN